MAVRKSSHRSIRKSGVKAVGSKVEVWHGKADHTIGGLQKQDLKKNKSKCIVSKRKSELGKKQMANMLKNKEHREKFISNQEKVRNGTL